MSAQDTLTCGGETESYNAVTGSCVTEKRRHLRWQILMIPWQRLQIRDQSSCICNAWTCNTFADGCISRTGWNRDDHSSGVQGIESLNRQSAR